MIFIIRTFTIIDGIDVSNDVLSIDTDQVGRNVEGSADSTCEITLHNSHQKYGNQIIGSALFTPRTSVILSFIQVTRNVVTGLTVNKQNDVYVAFIGVVASVNFDNEFCIIDGACATATLAATMSPADRTFAPTDTLIDKAGALIKDFNDMGQLPYEIVFVDATGGTDKVKVASYLRAQKSTAENLQQIAQEYSINIFTPSDQYGGQSG